MRRVACYIVLCGLFVGWACIDSPLPVSAQGEAWSSPFEVSGPGQFSWFPDIAVGPESSVHIIWGSGDTTINPDETKYSRDLLGYRGLVDGAWSESNDIVFTGAGADVYTVRNSIISGLDGRIHILVRMGTSIYASSADWRDAWSARVWDRPVRVSGNDDAYYATLVRDKNNTLHAFWSEAVRVYSGEYGCPNCSELFYRNSNDGGRSWSAIQNLSQTPNGENRPHIQVDPRNRMHIVWDEGWDFRANAGAARAGVYRRSDDGGQTWTEPVYFTVNGEPVQQTTVAVTSQGNPFVVFRSARDGRVFFQQSDDGGKGWGPLGEIPGVEARLSTDSGLDIYALATDSRDHIHLLMNGFLPGEASIYRSPSLYHLTWDGTRWSAPRVVMGDNDRWPEWPRLVISNGNQLHATWFTRRTDDRFRSEDRPNYQVWYSTLTISAPTVSPPPLFTPVPTALPSPTEMPAIAPSPTALPVNAREAPLLDGPPAWEQRGMQTIAMALAPVVVIIGFIAVVARLRR